MGYRSCSNLCQLVPRDSRASVSLTMVTPIFKIGTVSGTVWDPQVAVPCINLQLVEQFEGLPIQSQNSVLSKDLIPKIRSQNRQRCFAYETEGYWFESNRVYSS